MFTYTDAWEIMFFKIKLSNSPQPNLICKYWM